MAQSTLITGAAGGIGAAIAQLAPNHYDKVYLLDRDADQVQSLKTALSKEFPGTAFVTFAGSVTDSSFIDESFASIATGQFQLRSVFHCASILRGPSGLVGALELEMSEWESIIDINLTGSFLVARACLKAFLSTKSAGDLLLLGSSNAIRANAYDAPYAASKAGVVALAESLNEEVMRLGIRVQCLSPDAVDTPLWDQNNNILPRPPAIMAPSTVAEIALRMIQLPRDGYIRNLQLYPCKTRKRKTSA